MPRPKLLFLGGLLTAAVFASAQDVTISVDAAADRRPVSPYLYGKNDSPGQPGSPRTAADWQRFRDAGLRMMRTLGGNNGTKYNWQKKLTSHPDWYNNVYANDWDYAQAALQQNLPGVQAMWAFQLIGKVADNNSHNFNDWAYNQSQWWTGVGQNLAGGGTVNPTGEKALVAGNPNLYLTDSDPATSTAILDHWISPTGLGLDRNQFLYWSMDNEPEIWVGTHDDVMPEQLPAEEFMQRYFAYAKAARARFPHIKLTGPVPANEWQWYNYPRAIAADGRSYPWLEYFIKRVGEEQTRTGIRLLDVLDIHYYPGSTNPADIVQLHRTFFDETYVHPEANGVRTVNGGWDPSINREYIFGRCAAWLDQYLGADHGVTFGVTEMDIPVQNAPLASVWYASMLGEFMKHGVEIFTPWSWQPGMWEVMHLFSRYNGDTAVRAVSSADALVSGYATTDNASGALTVVLVNRALTGSTSVRVNLANATAAGVYAARQLANLPATETFVSRSENAVVTGSAMVSGNAFNLTLPALSITSVQIPNATSPTPVVPPTGSSRLANLSVRAVSGAGTSALTLGFVLGDGDAREVLIRGIGPSIAAWVEGAMADPEMILNRQAGGVLGTNDDWTEDQAAIAEASTRLGAFELPATSLDAAMLVDLPADPLGYTIRVGGQDNSTGVTLGEIYDGGRNGSARLLNVSARTWVGTGAQNLIAGFVIDGESNKTLLIRAAAPTLERWGVPGLMADPVLRIFRQGETQPIYQNDNWEDIAYVHEVVAAANQVGAFALDAGSKDAALLVTLPPGVYSAVVSGANNTTGVALVEVYDVE